MPIDDRRTLSIRSARSASRRRGHRCALAAFRFLARGILPEAFCPRLSCASSGQARGRSSSAVGDATAPLIPSNVGRMTCRSGHWASPPTGTAILS